MPLTATDSASALEVLPEIVRWDGWGFPILSDGHVAGGTGFETDRRSVEVALALEHLAHRVTYSCPRLALHLDD